MKRVLFLMAVVLCLQGSAHAYTYVPEGHVIEGMGNFARSLTAWVTDTKTLEVQQVYIGATQTSKAVPYKARFTLPVMPANLAIVARVAIQAGLMVGSSYLIPWLADQAVDWFFDDATNTIMAPGAYSPVWPIPGGLTAVSYGSNTGVCTTPNGSATWTHYLVTNYVPSSGLCSSWGMSYASDCNFDTKCGWGNPPVGTQACCYKYYSGGNAIWLAPLRSDLAGTPLSGESTAVPWGEVDAALEADFLANRQNGWELARDAMAAVGPGVSTQNQGWPQSGPDAPGNGLSPEQGAAVQTALNDSVTPDMKTALDTAAADDPDNPYGGWEDWEYSPNEIATAIETKLKPYLEPGEVTVDSEGDPPDKDSLPDVLDDFHDGVSSWQGLTLLNSLTLETNSANCNFCIDKPEILGLSGQVCYDCCPHESMLAGLGNILFGIMALCWLFWIFM